MGDLPAIPEVPAFQPVGEAGAEVARINATPLHAPGQRPPERELRQRACTELLRQAAGVSFNNVPYKGDVPAMTDVMGGQADLLFVPATSAVGFAQAGKLRALAVAGERRLAALPDVPTMAEAGQPQVVNYSWTSLAGPPGMPADVVERLNQACQSLLAEPEVVARLAAMSNEPTPGTPAQAASFIAAEVARWSEVVRKGNIQVQ